ncbi:MAG TPA: SRPBCC domain-containing protein [Acidimicrobiales bacterium]|nr:SRPBCC domain-containing protein [Acidimicrobiales bacterium]
MPDIRHRVVISAPLESVYEAVATPEGISEWWTRDGVRGGSCEGSELQFFFGQPEPAAVMEVTGLDPEGHVSWNCIGGADEWIGTTLTFDLTDKGDETVVMFTHADWRQPGEFMAHCNARWAYFLLSLKSLMESGKGTPFPEDLKF